ncbi:hypothetical protein D4764_22G0000280 [Takifugu flavidus]|uniref:Uncharacterized protein n=1 Tax=Takifugu flavidus TaxID=433684 RepID=A0A5C6ND20_9TELE|nr:hypothetical protein D4764_22G0000280 [Takifugu flavidus]
MTTRRSTTSLPLNQLGKDALLKTSDRLWLNTQTTTRASVTGPPTAAPSPSSPSPTDSTFPRPASSPNLLLLPTEAAESPSAFRNSGAGDGNAAMKNRMVVMVVLALAVLTLAVAVGGRKAMESFDRRHYTRLELNDLHYEV